MSKRIEIEGSADRAADRGRDAFEPIDAQKPFLGSPDVVDMLVRQFLAAVVDARKAYNAETIEGFEAAKRVQDEARRYGKIFMGKDDQYGALPWNSPDQLGRSLTAAFEPGGTTNENSAETLFLKLADDFISIVIVPAEEEKIADEDGQFRTDVLVEEAVSALMGIPADNAEL